MTNVKRLSQGIDQKETHPCLLIDWNALETIDAVEMAHRAGYTSVMSHRSGETEDYTIADLSLL